MYPAIYLDELLVENVDQIMIRFLTMINDDDRVKVAGDDLNAVIEAKRTTLNDFIAITNTFPLAAPLTAEKIAAVRAKHFARLEAEAEANLRLFSDGAPLDKTALVDLGLQALFRRPHIFLSQTGIVIAGYGTEDYFPSYVEFSCLEFVGDWLCSMEKGDHAITQRDFGFFKAFATTAMADTFTMGFGPRTIQSGSVASPGCAERLCWRYRVDRAKSRRCQEWTEAVDTDTEKWTADVFDKYGGH